MKRNRAKNLMMTLIKLSIATALIFWMIQKGVLRPQVLVENLNGLALFIGLGLVFVQIAINITRWWLLVRAQKIRSKFFELFELTFIGLFFNYSMPGGVGGDVVKAYYLVRGKTEQRIESLATVFIDRIIGLWAMTLLALGAVVFSWNSLSAFAEIRYLALALSLVAILFFVLFISASLLHEDYFQKIWTLLEKLPKGDAFQRVYMSVRSVSRSPMVVVAALALSLLAQSAAVLAFAYVGGVFGDGGFPLSGYFIVIPLGLIVTALPIAPAGIGVGQAALYFLFNLVQKTSPGLVVPASLGPDVMTAFQVMTFAWAIPGVIFYLRKGPAIRQEVEEVARA